MLGLGFSSFDFVAKYWEVGFKLNRVYDALFFIQKSDTEFSS